MTISTVAVTIVAGQFNGLPLTGGKVRIQATGSDVITGASGEIVVSEPQSMSIDSGTATANLITNTAGTQGTQYRFTFSDSYGADLFSVLATVPAFACNLHDIVDTPAPATVDAAQAAVNLARNWASQPTGTVDGTSKSAKAYAADAQTFSLQTAGVVAAVAYIYPGVFATAPTTRPDGSAIQAGDRYNNSTDGYGYVYVSGAWKSYEKNAAQSALSVAFLYPGQSATAPTTRPDTTAIQNGDRYNNSTDGFEYIRINGVWTNTANSAQAAQVSAAAALASQNASAASATNAGNYAAAAASGAKFFDTIALGLAGVADGAPFGVKSGGTDGLLRPTVYRRDSAVTKTLLYGVLTALEFDTDFQRTLLSAWAVSDLDGNVIGRIATGASLNIGAPLATDSSGGVSTSAVGLSTRLLRHTASVGDGDGNLPFYVDSTGHIRGDITYATGRAAQLTSGLYDYDINHVFGYGQSLAIGQFTYVAISPTQKYDNLMFVEGMRPQIDYPLDPDATRYASLVPAIEQISPVTSSYAETPMLGVGDCVKQLMQVEDGLASTAQSYQLLLSAPGFGSMTIAQLSKAAGTGHYERVITQATFGLSLANAANKSYAAQAVTWGQGESDYLGNTAQATYLSALNTLVANLNTDLKVATGQTKSVPLICYQIASHKVASRTIPTIALAQLQANDANALVHIAVPMYIFEYNLDDFHLTSISSRWLGAYFGLAYKRIVIDQKTWKPLEPLSSTRSGSVAYVKFNVPVGCLVLDTTNVTLNANYGFELFAADGVTPITINSVTLRGTDTVKIVAASAIPAGAQLHYAWSGVGLVGCYRGPRGNLRDQQGDYITFDPNGLNKPMHNWCVIFNWSL